MVRELPSRVRCRGKASRAARLGAGGRLLLLTGEQRGRKLGRISTLLRLTRILWARAVIGLAATARSDVSTASTAPTSRSTSRGNATTLTINTVTANRKPTKLPTTISIHPSGVVKI